MNIRDYNQFTYYFPNGNANVRRARHSLQFVGFGLHKFPCRNGTFWSYAFKIPRQWAFQPWRGALRRDPQSYESSNNTNTMSVSSSSTENQPSHTQECEAEAAHYALLRRLAPVIRHNMAGTLQPIAMVAAMLERRLQKADADPEALLKNARDIVALSKEAAASCVDLIGWLAPKDNRPVKADAGIAECLGMVVTQLSFRGFSVADDTGPIAAQLPQSALRNVLTAALIALTDEAATPGTVLLGAEFAQGLLSLHIELKAPDAPAPARAPEKLPYRALEWRDVQALAAQESVQLVRAANRLTLRFDATAATDPHTLAETAQA